MCKRFSTQTSQKAKKSKKSKRKEERKRKRRKNVHVNEGFSNVQYSCTKSSSSPQYKYAVSKSHSQSTLFSIRSCMVGSSPSVATMRVFGNAIFSNRIDTRPKPQPNSQTLRCENRCGWSMRY